MIVLIYVTTQIVVFIGIGISLFQNWGLWVLSSKSRLLRSAEIGNMLVENTLLDAANSLDFTKQEIENALHNSVLTPFNAYGILSTSVHQFNTYKKSDYLGLLLLIDANGQLIGRSDEYTSKTIDFSDRYYYRDLRDHPDKKYTVGPPLVARTNGQRVFHIAIPITSANTKFAGVLVRQLLEKDISSELRKYTEPSDFVQMMTHADNNPVSFVYPPLITPSLSSTWPLSNISFDTLESSKGTVFFSSSQDKKDDLLIGYSRSPVFGLTTFVSMPTTQIRQAFLKNNLYYFLYIFIGVVFIACIFFYLYQISIQLTLAQGKAFHDALTGLHNRRALYESMPLLLRESMREQSPVSVFFIDIDFFRLFNERSGHEAGDLALQAVAEALANCCRRPLDFICRWGGEEFVAVLPRTNNAAALNIAQTMLESVRSIQLNGTQPNSPNITVSVGFVTHILSCNDTETDLVDLADQAVRHAKHLGRDQCVQYDKKHATTS